MSQVVMSRLAARFAELKKEGRAAFVPFITAGDPDMETSSRHPGKAAGRGRRCDRAGHALHRSHGRRPGGAGLQRCARSKPAPPWPHV